MATAVFRERLVPGWPVFAFALAFITLIAVAYGAALGLAFGIALLLIAGAVTVAAIVLTSPVVSAGPQGLLAGSAHLPSACIGAVEVLDPEAMAALRAQGPRGMSTCFTLLRPSRSRSAVRVTVADPEDPHPAWIITSRQPADLASALQ